MKWIPTNGKGKQYPAERKQIVVKLPDGNMTTYQYTGSDISKICLRDQYEFWLDETTEQSFSREEVIRFMADYGGFTQQQIHHARAWLDNKLNTH